MKKAIFLLPLCLLAACKYDAKPCLNGEISINNEEFVSIKGYFQNANKKSGERAYEGFYYEYHKIDDSTEENFYYLNNYNNLDEKVRSAKSTWNFKDLQLYDDLEIIMKIEIENLSIYTLVASVDSSFDFPLIKEEINRNETKTLTIVFSLQLVNELNSQLIDLSLQINKKPLELSQMKEEINLLLEKVNATINTGNSKKK